MIPDWMKMCHLETLLKSNAKSSISRTGQSEQFNSAARSNRKTGRTHVIIDAQLENLKRQIKWGFTILKSWFFSLLLYLTWWTYSKTNNKLAISNQVQNSTWQLISYNTNLKEMVVLCWWQEWRLPWSSYIWELAIRNGNRAWRVPAFKGEHKNEKRRIRKDPTLISKISYIIANSNVKEMMPTQSNQCLLADGMHCNWNCPLFRNLITDNQYLAVRKQPVWYGCLGNRHATRDCHVNSCVKKRI